jgi:hypothetical protein
MPLHHVCEACIESNHQRTYFLKNEATKASKLLELVYNDVSRLMETTFNNATQYFVTFVDNFSRKTHVYFLKAKGEVFEKFKALVENQTSMKIKTLRFNNEREFVSKKIDDFLCECGVQQQTSAPYTP